MRRRSIGIRPGLVLGGSYFSMVLDNNLSEVEPDDPRTGGRQSASLIAVSALPVGVSYYRLSSLDAPAVGPRSARRDSTG
jgi:hypothetical protein